MSGKTVSPSRPFIKMKMTSSVYLPIPLPVLEMYTPIIVTQFPQKPLLMEKEKKHFRKKLLSCNRKTYF